MTASPDGDVVVRDNPAQHRFEIVVDGAVAGISQYRPEGDDLVFTHTKVDDAYEGQGLGSTLVRGGADRAARPWRRRDPGVPVRAHLPAAAQGAGRRRPPRLERERFGLA